MASSVRVEKEEKSPCAARYHRCMLSYTVGVSFSLLSACRHKCMTIQTAIAKGSAVNEMPELQALRNSFGQPSRSRAPKADRESQSRRSAGAAWRSSRPLSARPENLPSTDWPCQPSAHPQTGRTLTALWWRKWSSLSPDGRTPRVTDTHSFEVSNPVSLTVMIITLNLCCPVPYCLYDSCQALFIYMYSLTKERSCT